MFKLLAITVAAAGAIAATATFTTPLAAATPTWCTHDYPVAPPYAQCVNYSYGYTGGGFCWLNLPAYTPDGRAIPSSCAYYYNAPVKVPLPQLLGPE